MLYQILALIVLLCYGGIFFGKMLHQRLRGVKTNQFGGKQAPAARRAEHFVSFACTAAIAGQMIAISAAWSCLPAVLRWVGFVLGLAGCGIFLAGVIAMRDSWRAGIPKDVQTEFISGGIFRWSRNPAFFGFDLIFLGLTLLFCCPVTILVTVLLAAALHVQILQEEQFLAERFGAEYEQYQQTVSRYFGKRSVKS